MFKYTMAKWMFFALLLAGSFSIPLNSSSGGAAESLSADPAITLDARSEPLRNVLGRITKATGWRIKVRDRWMEQPVTETLNKAPLDEGLRLLLKAAGVENIMLTYDENTKVIEVFDVESTPGRFPDRPAMQTGAPAPVVPSTKDNAPEMRRQQKTTGSNIQGGTRRSGTRRRAAPEEE